MAKEPIRDKPSDPGFYTQGPPEPGVTATEVIAGGLSLVWLLVMGGFGLASGAASGGAMSLVMMLVAVILPVAMIWVAAITARTARGMREETRRLQAAIDAMRNAYVAQVQAGLARPSVEKKLDEIVAAQRQTESAIATFTTRRDALATVPSADRKAAFVAPSAANAADEQPGLALGTPAEALNAPISVEDFIQALNFPDNPDDSAGFRALRRALEDRALAKLIRAAQDILTLLSQDGIYMDDLKPDRAKPEVWRKFAQGERGRSVAVLGGVRDRSSLALSAGRMRQDMVFRDAAHHFLRQFDKTLTEFEKNASDQEVSDLADTRTARAFMLLGRVTGAFD